MVFLKGYLVFVCAAALIIVVRYVRPPTDTAGQGNGNAPVDLVIAGYMRRVRQAIQEQSIAAGAWPDLLRLPQPSNATEAETLHRWLMTAAQERGAPPRIALYPVPQSGPQPPADHDAPRVIKLAPGESIQIITTQRIIEVHSSGLIVNYKRGGLKALSQRG